MADVTPRPLAVDPIAANSLLAGKHTATIQSISSPDSPRAINSFPTDDGPGSATYSPAEPVSLGQRGMQEWRWPLDRVDPVETSPTEASQPETEAWVASSTDYPSADYPQYDGESITTTEVAGEGAFLETIPEPEDEKTYTEAQTLDDATVAQLAGDSQLKAAESSTGAPYMPIVIPTHTYQPRTPSISVKASSKHSSKPSSSSASILSKFNNRRRSSLMTAITTPPSPRRTRSPSVASSDASSAGSTHSNTVQIPEPGARMSVQMNHSRQHSDPRFMRFLGNASDNKRKPDPRKYNGYPGLVSHMTESQNLIFRRFDDVHVRMLLYLQDQIAQLENRLQKLDEQNDTGKGTQNGTFRYDPDPYRLEVMESLRVLLGEYDIMILTFTLMQEVKATDKSVTKLKDWLRKYSGSAVNRRASVIGGSSIAKNELDWVERADDLSQLAVDTGSQPTTSIPSPTRTRTGSTFPTTIPSSTKTRNLSIIPTPNGIRPTVNGVTSPIHDVHPTTDDASSTMNDLNSMGRVPPKHNPLSRLLSRRRESQI